MSNRGRLFDAQLLTGSFVYSAQVPLDDDKVELHVLYDPDEAATAKMHTIIEVSHDGLDTTAANSTWFQVGEISSSSGTLTYTARELQQLTTGAGTKKFAIWIESVQGIKFRVGIKETNAT